MLAEMRHAIHGSKSLVPLYDVLWFNYARKDDTFEGQTITIPNLSDYNLIIVQIVDDTNNKTPLFMYRTSVSAFLGNEETATETSVLLNPSVLNTDNGSFIASRQILIDMANNQIVFGAGKKILLSDIANSIEDNHIAIPVYILGTRI